MFHRPERLIVLMLLGFIFAAGWSVAVGDEAEEIDFASMDKAVLVILCENQNNEIQRLREEIEELKAQLAGDTGGSEVIKRGDITLIDNGSWDVTVTDVKEVDVTPYQDEIRELRIRLDGEIIDSAYRAPGQQTDGVEDRLRQAEQDLQDMMKRGKYKNRVNSSGNTISSSSNLDGYTDRELNEAKAAVRRLQGEKNGIDRKIMQLERRIEAERNTITALGMTSDGVPVTLIAKGVYVSVGKSLVPDETYTVVGRGEFDQHSGEITIKSAVKVISGE